MLVSHEGIFWNESESLLRTIEVRDSKLYYVRNTDSATELGALEDGSFFMVGIETQVNIEFQGSDESHTMTVEVDNEEPLVFKPLPEISGNVGATYTGIYWSAELQRELHLSVEGSEIIASWADDETRTSGQLVSIDDILVPQFIAVPWSPQDVRLHIEHDESGEITGLSLSSNMVRGVSFEKRS